MYQSLCHAFLGQVRITKTCAGGCTEFIVYIVLPTVIVLITNMSRILEGNAEGVP